MDVTNLLLPLACGPAPHLDRRHELLRFVAPVVQAPLLLCELVELLLELARGGLHLARLLAHVHAQPRGARRLGVVRLRRLTLAPQKTASKEQQRVNT